MIKILPKPFQSIHMKQNITRTLLAVVSLLLMLPTFAQMAASSAAPQGINYQSVARNAAGQILTNQPIGLQISIHDSSSAGAVIYQEHHTVVTNAFGTFSVVVGGGSIILGNFGGIQWGTADKYMQVDMDFTGGTTYTTMGTSKLLSVPFALYAGTSAADIKTVKYDTTGILNIQTAGNNFGLSKPVWLAGGNSGLNASNNWLGTIDNRDVIIKRGGVEGIRFTTGGAFLATGDNTGVTPASGSGKRMEWIPAKGAFRAGTVTGTAWDDANIGSGSIAMGTDALASAANSLAIGKGTAALATGATAIGSSVIARNPNSMIVGAYNDTSANAVDSVAAGDVLFQVGNGTSSTARGNALTVSKTGRVVATDLITKSMSLSDSVITVSGSFTINPTYAMYIVQTSVGNAAMTIAPGRKIGQVLIIECLTVGGNGHTLQLTNGTATHLWTATSGYSSTLADHGTLTLVWDGTYWTQIGRSDN